MIFTRLIAILGFISLMIVSPAAGQESAGQTLAKLEKLSPDNRQKVLIERARNEKDSRY